MRAPLRDLGVALGLGAGACLQAQALFPPVDLALVGEWHGGLATVPAGLGAVITDGRSVAFGLAFPVEVAPGWRLRPCYDEARHSGAQAFVDGPAYATARTTVKLRLLTLDVLRNVRLSRRAGTGPYLGVGVGVAQTWHRRENQGVLTIPGLPPGAETESWSPAGRLLAGFRLSRSLAFEAHVQVSAHTFEGRRFRDGSAALTLRFWPAKLAGGGEGPN